ncbi:FG-GAP-like repeat-containing protein, partial [Nodularia sphaerocarpa]
AGFTKENGGWINNNDFPRMLGDVNGDGKADIVGFGGSHTLVSLGNGNGTFQTAIISSPPGAGFTKENGGWINNNDFPRMLGDVNGDGKADIVGFGGSHVLISVASTSPSGLMATDDNLTKLMNGDWNNQKFDVDSAYGAQCWDLVAKATGINNSSSYWLTSNWRRGINVVSNSTVAVGTSIATFKGSNNSYLGHTGIFAGYDSVNGVSGFWAWSLNFPTGSGVRKHFIPINGSSAVNNNANEYYLIQL